MARNHFKIPTNKKIILFGAINATSDKRKGFKQLAQALEILDLEDTEIVVFGSERPTNGTIFTQKTHYLGNIQNESSLVALYSAVDVMVVPSLQESFGQTAVEAMSCGTPTVAFATSGLLDIIDHKETGYLASPFETEDFAFGIKWLLTNPKLDLINKRARNSMIKKFDSIVIANRYFNYYKNIIQNDLI